MYSIIIWMRHRLSSAARSPVLPPFGDSSSCTGERLRKYLLRRGCSFILRVRASGEVRDWLGWLVRRVATRSPSALGDFSSQVRRGQRVVHLARRRSGTSVTLEGQKRFSPYFFPCNAIAKAKDPAWSFVFSGNNKPPAERMEGADWPAGTIQPRAVTGSGNPAGHHPGVLCWSLVPAVSQDPLMWDY